MADTYGEMMARINADLINSKNSGIDTNALNNINRENRDIIISISNTLNSYYREQSKFSKIISILSIATIFLNSIILFIILLYITLK
ncbi:hypothetical protein I6H88_13640 [Elizabethkingia bruuniana]|uniref:Uncharacterized protein n=1 Tax=Elizabethkingia bruuniana TaxID=1756149 RepID=A0A7T7UWP1_9FLAO|nr:hypothetical protein [Elizabethkingia bruuniana]QQN57486.1 hypothetical protein I6H88_13640 [Elizabethkingia bruuniana]